MEMQPDYVGLSDQARLAAASLAAINTSDAMEARKLLDEIVDLLDSLHDRGGMPTPEERERICRRITALFALTAIALRADPVWSTVADILAILSAVFCE